MPPLFPALVGPWANFTALNKLLNNACRVWCGDYQKWHCVQLPQTSLFASILGVQYGLMTVNVVLHRNRAKVAFGEGDDADLALAVRAHGNFQEYAPLGLILLGLIEANGGNDKAVKYLGASLVASRVLHAVALQWPYGKGVHVPLRASSVLLTLVSIVGGAVVLGISLKK